MTIIWMIAFSFLSVALVFPVSSATADAPAGLNTVVTPVEVAPKSVNAAAQPSQDRQIRRHYPDPELIRSTKAAYASGKTGPSKHGNPPPPPPVPQQTASSAASLSFGNNFVGLGFLDTLGYWPPDTTIAAGTVGSSPTTSTALLEAVNLTAEVFDTSGTAGSSFDISSFTPDSFVDSVSDPRVLHDSANGGHWLISLTTFAPLSDSGWNLAVSVTNDPAGSYYFYHFSTAAVTNPDGSVGNFPDFPKIGFNGDKIVLTGNAFSTVQKGLRTSYKFQGSEFIALNKDEIENGGPTCATFFPPPQGAAAIEPALQLPATSTTTSSNPDNLYMAAVNSSVSSTSTLDVWTVTGLPTYNGSSCPGNFIATVTPLSIGAISTPANAQQLGTSVLIDTNDDSLLDAVFRDGSPGSLWVSANDGCVPTGDSATRSCARLIEVSIPASSSMSVAQDFDFVRAGSYYYYPAVRTNSSGDLIAVFSGSSSASYASVYAAMQLSGDQANTAGHYGLVHAGDAPDTMSPPRWGDYSGAGVDPDDTTFWIAGEYATSDPFFGSIWGTWVASVP